nr:MAG TPA: hypothetical protein [Caudoviricetes sp.]
MSVFPININCIPVFEGFVDSKAYSNYTYSKENRPGCTWVRQIPKRKLVIHRCFLNFRGQAYPPSFFECV